ncbi:hypothetical protein Goshw_008060, partial [Gossypium schwendimanii]|nr:hypothetical protein [Gossypium schwendimanii]
MIGGVVRDSRGNWVEGFRRVLSRGSTLNFELWAILYGLEVARLKKYTKVIIESDCRMAIEILKETLTVAR